MNRFTAAIVYIIAAIGIQNVISDKGAQISRCNGDTPLVAIRNDVVADVGELNCTTFCWIPK